MEQVAQAIQTGSKMTIMDAVRHQLDNLGPQFARVLPPNIKLDTFTRTVMTTVQMNPDLLKYERKSLFAACMKAAEDGLLIDGKEAAIIPYKGKLSYIAMKQGLINKAIKSGKLSGLSVHVAYENDHFECILGDDERIVHSRDFKKFDDRGSPIAYYAIAKLKDGSVYRCIMSQSQVNKRRDASQSSKNANSPWVLWTEEQGQKTVVKKLLNMLPFSPEELGANVQDEDIESEIVLVNPSEEPNATEPQDITPIHEEAPREPENSVRERLGIKIHPSIDTLQEDPVYE